MTEHLTPADRDLLAKAKAAQKRAVDWYIFLDAANPAAIIDLLTRLGEAREDAQRMRHAIENADADLRIAASDYLPNSSDINYARGKLQAVARGPAAGEGTTNAQ